MHSYPGFQETAEATIHAGNIVYVQTGECEARFKNIMLVNSNVVIMLLINFIQMLHYHYTSQNNILYNEKLLHNNQHL